MREIKFRGYGKFEKKWVYGYGLHQVIFGVLKLKGGYR